MFNFQANASYIQANTANKLGTMQALGDYVSNMVPDYFNTDYLRQKIVGNSMVVKTGDTIFDAKVETQKDEIKVPKFMLRQQNFVSQIEIDKNTRFYMTRLRIATGHGGNAASALHRFDEFNRHLAEFPFAKGVFSSY